MLWFIVLPLAVAALMPLLHRLNRWLPDILAGATMLVTLVMGIVHINLIAVIECAKVVLPVMLRQKSGHIINVASIAGLVALPGSTIYAATKFGVNGFSDALRRELRGSEIHVSAFCPGFTPTEINPELKAIADGKPGAPHRPGLMPVTYVADQIARLIRHPRRQMIIPPSWKILVIIAFLFPGIADKLIGFFISKETKGKE